MNLSYLISKFIKKLHIPAIRNSKIDKSARVCSGAHLVDVDLGRYSYIGNFCTVINAQIGKFCSIEDNCIIGGASHPIEWVSTSPVFYEGRNVMNKNFSLHPYNTTKRTIIGNDVWIGSNCLIKSGVSIGNGVIIGMGSIVTKNVEPYTIVAGNPATIIRKRFDRTTINILIKYCWWDWKEETLINEAKYFSNIELFISKLELNMNEPRM